MVFGAHLLSSAKPIVSSLASRGESYGVTKEGSLRENQSLSVVVSCCYCSTSGFMMI